MAANACVVPCTMVRSTRVQSTSLASEARPAPPASVAATKARVGSEKATEPSSGASSLVACSRAKGSRFTCPGVQRACARRAISTIAAATRLASAAATSDSRAPSSGSR
jgi:hypothetical protein